SVLDSEEGARNSVLVFGGGVAHPLRGVGLGGARRGILTCLPGETVSQTPHSIHVRQALQQRRVVGGQAVLDSDVLAGVRCLQLCGPLLGGLHTCFGPLRLGHLRLLVRGEISFEGLDLLLLRVVSADQRVVVRQPDRLALCAAVPVRFGGGCRLRGQISRSRDRIISHRLLSQFGLFPAPVRLGVVIGRFLRGKTCSRGGGGCAPHAAPATFPTSAETPHTQTPAPRAPTRPTTEPPHSDSCGAPQTAPTSRCTHRHGQPTDGRNHTPRPAPHDASHAPPDQPPPTTAPCPDLAAAHTSTPRLQGR